MLPHRPEYEPNDPDFAARVREGFASQAVMATLGIRIEALGPGWVEFDFAPPSGFTQQDGYLHAGVAATALDSACGYAALTLTSPGIQVLTSGYKVDLVRPANSDRYTARGWVVKPGRKLTVSSAELLGSDGRVVAIMTGTIVAL
ncbi:MAG: PaaI family thioesterase [Acidimicrobiia bacterium]|nr:PaaI family thioesterase [Acidimicrobiia bacterium]